MTSTNRPLSPHIQIYKPQISSFTSILHRATGIFLYIGVVIMCWAIVHYAYQVEIFVNGDAEEDKCNCVWQYFFYAVAIAWSFSLYYHLFNGIRHLFWDIGKGFDKNFSKRSGLLVLFLSVLATAFSFYYALFFL
jgi:succinate dehydrogenase / fumarate reductase cytochrome b subunit